MNKKRILILAAAVLVAIIATLTLTLGRRGSDAVTGSVNTIAKPLKTLMSGIVDDLEDLYGYLYRYDQLQAENDQLRARIAELEQEYREYIEVSDENARLRALLGLSERNADYKYASATVISWTSSNWGSSFTMDKGSAGGVHVGDPVITENGALIGRVTAVSTSTSTITTILDTDSSIGAEDSQTNELAVAQGDFELMKKGQLKLNFLPNNYSVKAGDTIVTSGGGGTYPQGLVIGTVDEVVVSSSGLTDYAVITPSADLANLEFLYIITSYNAD
jgi:rod shape-determining protein MreC